MVWTDHQACEIESSTGQDVYTVVVTIEQSTPGGRRTHLIEHLWEHV